MRLLKLRFLVLGVALFVPIWLLVDRALGSVGFERQARHDAVAERVFDEIERELSALLRREEARPFDEYSFYYSPGKKAGRPDTVSPLAESPGEDWLIGYFQINPDGSFQTPHQPLDEARATREGDWNPTPEKRTTVQTLKAAVAGRWSEPEGAKKSAVLEREEQLAGTTVELSPKRALQAPQEAKAKSKEYSAYDALSSLNRGVRVREQRRARLSQKASPETLGGARRDGALPDAQEAVQEEGFARFEADLADGKFDDARIPGLESAGEANAAATRPPSSAPAREPAGSARRGGRVATEMPASPRFNQAVRTELTPMGGLALDANRLVLFRMVLHGSRGYRQGLVLDTQRLVRWLANRAVGSSELDGLARLRFATVFDPPPELPPASLYAYRRRFAEPFADLSATLELEPLPGLGGESYVLALSALLVVVGVLGLLALYRMVAVALRFAERRSNFAAAVSHELKTPLTAIRMYAEMLRDGMVDSDEKRHEYYEAMTTESERLSRLIHNVLEFSQLEKGKRALAHEVGPLEPVIRETERLLRTHVEREGFTLDVELEPDLPAVRFDRDALLQVLFNLVDNAIKYAAQATDRRITLRCEPSAGGVRISVRDFGPGVPSPKLSRVFEPFYREEAELTRRTKGTGIGLALVQGLVQAMDGQVSAENAAPTGLRVSIRLSAAQS